jgi:propanol-preferring alcohol dehydrogenase
MTMMDAVRYHGPDVPLTFEKVPKPDMKNLSYDDVIVEIKATSLCHTELHFADGTLNLGVKPITLGHECVGIITHHNNNEKSRIGERVIVYYYDGCGSCRWCTKGEVQICDSIKAEYGFLSDGGLAEYIVAPSKNAIVLPDHVSFIDAAPIGCGVTTAVHASKMGNVNSNGTDNTVLIYGCNGVGFGLVQLMKNVYGIQQIIVVTRSESKRKKALELGATHVIDGTDPSTVASTVREMTDGNGVDVIFECVGRRETMDACIGWVGALGKRGRLVLVGYHAGDKHDFRYVRHSSFFSSSFLL